MIPVEWFVGSVLGINVLGYALARLLLREIHSLTRAVIADTPKDLVMLEQHAAKPKTLPFPKRRPAEHEDDFVENTPRVMGL